MYYESFEYNFYERGSLHLKRDQIIVHKIELYSYTVGILYITYVKVLMY